MLWPLFDQPERQCWKRPESKINMPSSFKDADVAAVSKITDGEKATTQRPQFTLILTDGNPKLSEGSKLHRRWALYL